MCIRLHAHLELTIRNVELKHQAIVYWSQLATIHRELQMYQKETVLQVITAQLVQLELK